MFQAPVGQQLHADTDAEERPALLAHRPLECVAHARHSIEAALAVGESTDTWKHDTIGG